MCPALDEPTRCANVEKHIGATNSHHSFAPFSNWRLTFFFFFSVATGLLVKCARSEHSARHGLYVYVASTALVSGGDFGARQE
jgi:hypothetical protein